MDLNSDNVEIVEEMEEVYSGEDLVLELKIEKLDEEENIKTEVFKEPNNSESFQISGEKRKNEERSNLENEIKKNKEEFAVFIEESDCKQEPQETEKLNRDDVNNKVTNMYYKFSLMKL